MNVLSRQMLRLIQSSLQVGEDAPTYIIKLKRPHEFNLPPKQLNVPEGGVVSIETTGSEEFGCSTATIKIENCYGFKSPEFLAKKHQNDSPMIKDYQPNNFENEYHQYLVPETWIQICLGYGWMIVPVLTGAIDTSDINSQDSTITINIRDNMRYLVDQHIDVMIHGKELAYPRTDNLVIGASEKDPEVSNKIRTIKIVNVNNYLNVRTGPSTDHDAVGKAYNGQLFQYVDEIINQYGKKWYKILFNGEVRWIYHEYAEIVNTSATIKTRGVVKVDKIQNNTGNHLHVRSGPGTSYPVVEEVYYGEILNYKQTQDVNNVPWFNISYMNSDGVQSDGWICGNYASVNESNIAGNTVKDFHNHLHVKALPDSNSADVGLVYDGNTYTFISTTQDESGNYWHQISFVNEDGYTVQGWLDDTVSSYEQEAEVISFHTIVQVHGVNSHLHIRSGPSVKYQVLTEVSNNMILPYIGSVKGEDGNSIWHHILYMGKDGNYHEGYAHSAYLNVQKGYQPDYADDPDKPELDPSIMLDMTATTNADNNKWTASAVVHDLSVQAVYIGGRGGPPKLDRKICDVWTSEYTIKDKETNQPSRYVVNELHFPYTMNYFDSAMQIVNQMGNMSFRCNRYGDIMLFRNKQSTQYDVPDFEVKDYVDLTEASLKYNVQDMRSRVLVISDNGSSLFIHKGIEFNQCKGVCRQFGIKVPFADTLEKRKEVARAAFQQIVANWRRMQIAVVGNPLIEVNHVIKVYDMVTTATSLYRVAEFKHYFSNDGFITQMELVWIAVEPEDAVSLLTEDIPSYAKRFRYNLKFTGSIKPMKFKMSTTIYQALIKLKNPLTDEIYVNINVQGKTVTEEVPQPPATKKYIKLIKDKVNVRSSANLADEYIKKIRNAGFVMEYIAEVGSFYKGIDPEDGQEAYIWADYCITYEQNGNTSTNLFPEGAVSTFLSLVESKIGCGYAWGAQGQILTLEVKKYLEETYGYSHYHLEDGTDVDKWLGEQVFDCSGFIVWCLQQMGLISSSSDYTVEGIFKDLCYEISNDDIQPGDLFFRQSKGGIYHVGVIIEGGEVVEARGTDYGVIRRALPEAEKYGRIKKLANATSYNIPEEVSVTPTSVNVTAIPESYTISTTFDVESAPQSVKDRVQQLNGNLLFYKDDCVLYYVGVESNGGDKNELVLKWAPLVSSPVNLDLMYEVLMY